MKSTVVYIHGFDSSPASETAQAIKKRFHAEKFICPHINHRDDPDNIKKQMDALAAKLRNEDDPVVVGSSAGGLWADYMAAMYGFKTVLINPALRPSILFKKFNLPEAYIKKYAALEKLVTGKHRHVSVAFSGDKDDIVPTEHVKTHYANPIMLKGEGHRLKDLTPVHNMVGAMIGNFPERN